MQETSSINVLLHLDPWVDNAIDPRRITNEFEGDWIEPLRLRDYGVTPSELRHDNIPWERWVDSIEAMLRRADEQLAPHGDRDVHYYISGRAPLPLYAYLGVRLSKWACRMTVVNRRAAKWDVTVIEEAEDDSLSFFEPARQLDSLEEVGKVAVFISTDHAMNLDVVRDYTRERGEPLVGVVELQTSGRRWITPNNAAYAAAEIDAELRGLRRQYPHHSGLVVFVAGPVQLATMVGRAINPRIHGPVEFPNFVGPHYIPATRFPRPPAREALPKILILTANPSDQVDIRDEEEVLKVKDMLRRSLIGARVEPLVEMAVTPEDFMWAMNRHGPQILHISAHGSPAGDLGLVNEAGTLQTAPRDGVVEAIRTAGKSIRVVVLNACHSAKLARELIEHVDHIEYVIGVEEPLLTATAIDFAKGFYLALGEGNDIATALAQGRALAKLRNQRRADKIEGFAREGFDPTTYIPFPKKDDPE